MTGSAQHGGGSCAAATLPAPQAVHPLRVYCPIESAYRDLQVAADACTGRFSYAGETLDLGLPPDWLDGGLVHDDEWRIEWSKFYFGLDLAHAYSVNRDPSYVQAWEELVRSWIEQVPIDRDPTDVAGRRVQNWVYAWQFFDRVPGFPGLSHDFQDVLLASLREQLDYIAANLTPERNHRTLELYALLVVSLSLPVLDPDGVRVRDAWSLLQANLLSDVWSDGVHRERSTHYHSIALRSFLAARINVPRFGIDVPAEYDERLLAACRFAMHLHRPDGQIPALSDSDSGSYLDLLLLAGQVFDRPELLYVATHGKTGTPPAERGAGFRVGGYYTQRSGWGEHGTALADERYLVFGCGRVGDGGHGHYDSLSVEAYAHGAPLVVDPGRYTYAEGSPNWRHWFKGTAAHNTVTVDGLDQIGYRRGKPKDPLSRSRLLDRRSTDGFDLLHGEVASGEYDAVHRRAVVFVADEYWLVFDELRAPSAHDYVLRWHLPSGAAPDITDSSATTPELTLAFAGGTSPTVQPGWVSTIYGVKEAAPIVAVTSDGAVPDVDFVTLLSPRRSGKPGARRFSQADVSGGVVIVESPDVSTDHISWRRPDQTVTAGGLELVGETAWIRVDGEGRLLRAAVRHPSAVRWLGDGDAPRLVEVADGWHTWTRRPTRRSHRVTP